MKRRMRREQREEWSMYKEGKCSRQEKGKRLKEWKKIYSSVGHGERKGRMKRCILAGRIEEKEKELEKYKKEKAHLPYERKYGICKGWTAIRRINGGASDETGDLTLNMDK